MRNEPVRLLFPFLTRGWPSGGRAVD